MKAVICPRYGPPEVLQLQEVQQPDVGPNDVLINIRATTVTAGDTRMRRGSRKDLPFWPLPLLMLGIRRPRRSILGTELAGVVAAVGAQVTRFKPGDAVLGSSGMRFGSYAEYIALPETGSLALKPAGLSFEQAAAIPAGATSALFFLERASLKPGEHVLIYGASGSVGTYAVQLAKHFGATVTAVCSTSNVELVRSLGADHVIDYTRADFARSGTTYDVVFDTVGKTTFRQCRPLLKPGGRYAAAVVTGAMIWQKLLLAFGSDKKIIIGVALDTVVEPLNTVLRCLEAGHLRPVIDRSYPLKDVSAAHQYVDQGHKIGNVIMTIS